MQAKVEPAAAPTHRRGTVIIDREKCLKCAVLAPDINTKAFDCTYESGNKNCPARDLIVVIGVDADRAGRGIAKALNNGDFARTAALLERLENYHPTVQAQIMRVFREEVINSALHDAVADAGMTDAGDGGEPEATQAAPQSEPAAAEDQEGGEDAAAPAQPDAPPTATTSKDAAAAADKADWDD